MISFPLVKYVLTAALRDRLILALFVTMAVGASLGIFLGSAAITESDRFAMVFAAGGLRLAGAMGLVLFVVFYLRRAFDSKEVEFLLSRPVSRIGFLLSHSLAFTLLAGAAAGFVMLAVYAVAPHAHAPGGPAEGGFELWGVSLLAEYIIIANAALFFAMVLPNAAAGALAVFGFYVLCRLMGQLLGIIHAGILAKGYTLLTPIMHGISLVIPRLDLMAQTSWLVYGPAEDSIGFGFILLQLAVFYALIMAAAGVDLIRRQF